MCRLGLASTLKIGQTFPGIVLSSEATIFASPADYELVQTHGISGINCSWNRFAFSVPLMFVSPVLSYRLYQ